MSKRSIVNIFLLVIVAALTIYVKKNPVKDSDTINFTNLKEAEEVETIVIQRADETQIILEKTGEEWLLTAPIEGSADPAKLNLLLKLPTLKSRHQHKITEQKQLYRYELDPPKVSLFLDDYQFEFGNTNDFNKLRYILHEGVVHSVKDITHHLLIAPPESFLKQE